MSDEALDGDALGRLRSKDPNVSGLALGELEAQGSAAVPVLREALRSPEVHVRRTAIEGLGDIADPASAQDVRSALSDSDGQVRSLAAVALARMGEPDALTALSDTLDDWPDLAHSELSRSTYELPRLGIEALTVAIPLLASDRWNDRAKGAWIALAVLEHAEVDDELDELGRIVEGFDADASPEERRSVASAADRWLRSSGLTKDPK